MEVFSVGHSNLTAAELLALLREHEIALVADVRRFPVSKRHPQHARPALEASLRGAGLDYAFLGRELGGRLEPELPIERSENRALREPALRAYADALASPAFAVGFARLEELARSRRLAYLCAERDWRQCHRRILSDALVARGWRVLHLAPANAREAHVLDPHARVADGQLSYPSLL
jgi:uncharacterized protein (DUF488 family)